MTMTTYFRTDAPVNPMTLLDRLTVWVGGDPKTCGREVKEAEAFNHLGQGFKAYCGVEWSEGPLNMEYLDRPSQWSIDNNESWEREAPVALVQASFDTGYGYQGEEGGCGHLHAVLITKAAAWVKAQYPDANCWWYNGETCGRKWPDSDDIARLVR